MTQDTLKATGSDGIARGLDKFIREVHQKLRDVMGMWNNMSPNTRNWDGVLILLVDFLEVPD